MPAIALQLYSVRNELSADMPGTLAAVAQIGYTGVEFAGAPQIEWRNDARPLGGCAIQHTALTLKARLDDLGLVCCGWHVPFALVQDEAVDETIAFHYALGNDKLIIPGIPAELRQSRDDWLKLADFTNRLAERLAPEGMRIGYHNHHHEFTPMDGETPWDTFFSNTDSSVIMQLDTGNGIFGGAEPARIIRAYPGRAVTVHLKPYTKRYVSEGVGPHAAFEPVIGEDDTDWPAVFDACETVGGTEWYIVEYESSAYPPLEAVARCWRALRNMGK